MKNYHQLDLMVIFYRIDNYIYFLLKQQNYLYLIYYTLYVGDYINISVE